MIHLGKEGELLTWLV